MKNTEEQKFVLTDETTRAIKMGCYILMFAVLIGLYAEFVVTEGRSVYGMFFYDVHDTFMDFINSLRDAMQPNPYAEGVIYPPFTYLLLRAFTVIFPEDVREIYLGTGGLVEEKITQETMLAVIFFLIISIGAYVALTYMYKNGKPGERAYFTVIMMLSLPFLNAVERGNVIILSYAGVLAFLTWKDSDSRFLREMGLICLAFAASLKGYPCVFGLLLIKEKRWGEAIRAIIYGIAVFFLPFLLFGGFDQFFVMWHNIQKTTSGFNGAKYLRYDFSSFIITMLRKVGLAEKPAEFFANLYRLFFAIMGTLGIFRSLKPWKKILILSLMVIGLPGFSNSYTGLFLVLPFMALFNSDYLEKRDIKYIILMMGMLFAVPFTNNIENLPRDWFYLHDAMHTKIAATTTFILSILVIRDICLDRKYVKTQEKIGRDVEEIMNEDNHESPVKSM